MPAVVFEASGNSTSMIEAFEYTTHRGKLTYVGLVKADITFSESLFHSKELTLMASRNATLEDFHYVIESIEKGGN